MAEHQLPKLMTYLEWWIPLDAEPESTLQSMALDS
jgi:hypothetical protein